MPYFSQNKHVHELHCIQALSSVWPRFGIYLDKTATSNTPYNGNHALYQKIKVPIIAVQQTSTALKYRPDQIESLKIIQGEQAEPLSG